VRICASNLAPLAAAPVSCVAHHTLNQFAAARCAAAKLVHCSRRPQAELALEFSQTMMSRLLDIRLPHVGWMRCICHLGFLEWVPGFRAP
jgi:hypothetical protein